MNFKTRRMCCLIITLLAWKHNILMNALNMSIKSEKNCFSQDMQENVLVIQVRFISSVIVLDSIVEEFISKNSKY